MAEDGRDKLKDQLANLKKSMGRAAAENATQEDAGQEDEYAVADAALDAADEAVISAAARKQQKVIEEKQDREDQQKEFEDAIDDEDLKKRVRSRHTVLFQYYLDFGSIAVIGLVFFLTCLTGILSGVTQKMLMIRAILSVGIASLVIYVVRQMIMNFFNAEKEKEAKQDREEAEGKRKGFDDKRQKRRDVE
ncbi:MAG: hypothetical protein ACUZ8E_13670 [Candidatus Anammoxibacter sp.]